MSFFSKLRQRRNALPPCLRPIVETLEDRYTPATVQFASTAFLFTETNGQIVLPLTRTGTLTGTDTVDFQTVNGSAIQGERFQPVSLGTVTFAPNEVTKNIAITLIDNTTLDFEQTFGVNLVAGGTATIGAASQASVTVRDNDSALDLAALGATNAMRVPANSQQYLAYSPAGELSQLLEYRPAGTNDGHLLFIRRDGAGVLHPELIETGSAHFDGLSSVQVNPPANMVFDSQGAANVVVPRAGGYFEHYKRTFLGWQLVESVQNALEVDSFSAITDVSVVAGATGALHLAYQTRDFNGDRIYYGTNQSGSWIFEQVAQLGLRRGTSGDFGELPRAVSLAVDAQGRAYLARSNGYQDLSPAGSFYGRPYSELYFSTNETGVWSHQLVHRPPDDSGDSALSASLALNPEGVVTIASYWVERVSTGSVAGTALLFHTRLPGGGFLSEAISTSSDNYNASDGNLGTGAGAHLEYGPNGRPHIVFSDGTSRHNPHMEFFTGQIRHAVKEFGVWRIETVYRQTDPVTQNIVFPEIALSPNGGEISFAGLQVNDYVSTNYVIQSRQIIPPNMFSVASAINSSDENLRNVITGAYYAILGRLPDADGLNNWLSAMRAGVTDEQLHANFFGSTEYVNGHGGFDGAGRATATWVQAIYNNLLGRDADAGGMNSWVSQLNQGVSPIGIAYGFTASDERRAARINDAYVRLLGRTAEQPGIVNWIIYLRGGHRYQEIEAGLFASYEYYVNRAAGSPVTWLHLLYQEALHRPADTTGFNTLYAAL